MNVKVSDWLSLTKGERLMVLKDVMQNKKSRSAKRLRVKLG
ncbi:hypothetical protein [Paenibacillus albiflavus]|nr:hypothetical protein [Paenibacillus albiflavus]